MDPPLPLMPTLLLRHSHSNISNPTPSLLITLTCLEVFCASVQSDKSRVFQVTEDGVLKGSEARLQQ